MHIHQISLDTGPPKPTKATPRLATGAPQRVDSRKRRRPHIAQATQERKRRHGIHIRRHLFVDLDLGTIGHLLVNVHPVASAGNLLALCVVHMGAIAISDVLVVRCGGELAVRMPIVRDVNGQSWPIVRADRETASQIQTAVLRAWRELELQRK